MKKLENHTRFNVNLPDELLAEIKDYQFNQRLDNRNDAIRVLLIKGLQVDKQENEKKDQEKI